MIIALEVYFYKILCIRTRPSLVAGLAALCGGRPRMDIIWHGQPNQEDMRA